MTQAVEHPVHGRVSAWLARPSPALRYGIKLATSVTAAIWIADVSNLSWSLTIWLTVMLVAGPNAGASIAKGLLRIWGTAAAALISIAIYGLFAQQPPLYLASVVGVIALGTYGMTGSRDQYAWMVFGLTAIIILVKGMIGSDQIETLAFERATLTALGVLIVFVADAVFWPERAEEQLRESLAQRTRQLGEMLRRSLDATHPGQAPGEKGALPASPLIQQLGLVAQARGEVAVAPGRAQALTRIALLLEGLASRERLLRRDVATGDRVSAAALFAALEQLGRDLDAALGEAARALAADRTPERFADALARPLARVESQWLARLQAHPGGGGEADQERTGALSTLVPVLSDVVSVLRRLEDALVGLASGQAGSGADPVHKAQTAPIRDWFRLDPIRVQLALRAGMAAGGVIVLMLIMGWNSDEDVLSFIFAPIVAFIFAGMFPTRGAGTLVGVGWALGVLLGWLIADLASAFLFTHLDRMPLSLLYPFAIAGGAGYLIVRGSPLGTFGALFGMITAVLPIFIGDGPPEDVDAAYGLVCGVMLGLATGRIAQLLLWPRTASQTFLERAAAQLELCLRALGGAEPPTERALADLVSAYAKQLAMLGQVHAQAQKEPLERELDDGRRAALLALTQDLFDTALRGRKAAAAAAEAPPPQAAAALAPLREALRREQAAVTASIERVARALRGAAIEPDPGLREAHSEVSSCLDALRARGELAGVAEAGRSEASLAALADQRALSESQLAIETWLSDWRRAEATAPGAPRAL
jgi:uncharacterized membrane protein YccC